jgi:hypothetical protein
VGYEKRWQGHRLTQRVVRRRPPREIGGRIGSHGGVHTIVVSRGCLSAFVFGFRLAWFPFPASRSQPLWTLQRDSNGSVTPLKCWWEFKPNCELSRPKSRERAKQGSSVKIERKRHGRLALPRNRDLHRDSWQSAAMQAALSYSPRGSKLKPSATQPWLGDDCSIAGARAERQLDLGGEYLPARGRA